MKLIAIFNLTPAQELIAELCDVETKELVGRVDDDRADGRPFQERVKDAATEMGCEVVEWDRSQLAS